MRATALALVLGATLLLHCSGSSNGDEPGGSMATGGGAGTAAGGGSPGGSASGGTTTGGAAGEAVGGAAMGGAAGEGAGGAAEGGAGGVGGTAEGGSAGAVGGTAEGGSGDVSGAGGDGGTGAVSVISDPVGPCDTVIETLAPTSAAHVESCSEIIYPTNPPSGGPHYPVWAAFQEYDFPVPHGYLVHAMEHGAVVFFYNCPGGCDDEVEEVRQMIDDLPEDPLCVGTGALRRAILTPDPELDARWGAGAWGYAMRAECVDAEQMTDFYMAHEGNGPEQLCGAGLEVTEADCM